MQEAHLLTSNMVNILWCRMTWSAPETALLPGVRNKSLITAVSLITRECLIDMHTPDIPPPWKITAIAKEGPLCVHWGFNTCWSCSSSVWCKFVGMHPASDQSQSKQTFPPSGWWSGQQAHYAEKYSACFSKLYFYWRQKPVICCILTVASFLSLLFGF